MGIYQIAIDGPSGSGKSTLAKGIAKELGIMYLDTGAMYRTCAVASIKNGINAKDADAVKKMMDEVKIEVAFIDGVQHMILDGEDVTGELRTPQTSIAASDISALPFVRAAMVSLQREIAKNQTFVLDGRDIASVVLPDAKYKFFVVCAPEVRAERRLKELNEAGDHSQSYEEVLRDIKYRDEQDSTRAASPLIRVPEAIVIDTGKYDIDGTREFLLSHLEEEDK